jgi:hypothetical protein
VHERLRHRRQHSRDRAIQDHERADCSCAAVPTILV